MNKKDTAKLMILSGLGMDCHVEISNPDKNKVVTIMGFTPQRKMQAMSKVEAVFLDRPDNLRALGQSMKMRIIQDLWDKV